MSAARFPGGPCRVPRAAHLLPGCAWAFLAFPGWLSADPAPAPASVPASTPLTSHLQAAADLGELRGLTAQWDGGAGTLTLHAANSSRYPWAVIPAPPGGWDLPRREAVTAEFTNTGPGAVSVLLWVVSDRGWDAVPASATLEPGETRVLSCALRETFPDGTPKIDPHQVRHLQIILPRLHGSATLEVRQLLATGQAPPWQLPPGRLEVPPLSPGPPAPGQRVRFQLPGDAGSGIASILYLPPEWKPGTAPLPVIVEYPGNIFFTTGCYSTGLPDQCVIGYGMTRGVGAILLSLPFVDRQAGIIAEHGWGDPADTAEYAIRMVDLVCAQFGGDRKNLVLTGFSRGAIACGFIGLRDARIGSLWKGLHACQHADGDGWNGASLEGAQQRARHFQGRSVFYTDNPEPFFRSIIAAMRTEATFVQSGLGAHACAMFLDDRPSTEQLRRWFQELVAPSSSSPPAP